MSWTVQESKQKLARLSSGESYATVPLRPGEQSLEKHKII